MTAAGHDELVDEIRQIVARSCKLNVGEVPAAARLVDLGVDSVSVVAIMMEIEDACSVELSEHDPEFAKVKTVDDLAAFVERVSQTAHG